MRGPSLWLATFLAAAAVAAGAVVAAEPSSAWSPDEAGLGTWETCDTCDECLLDDAPQPPPSPPPGADGKVHCARCLGCNVVLSRLDGTVNTSTLEAPIRTSVGRSGAAVLAGRTRDRGDVIVKMTCGVPGGYRQFPSLGPTPPCADADPSAACPIRGGKVGHGRCNYAFISALDQIAVDANLSRVVGRSWTAEVRSFLPKKTSKARASLAATGRASEEEALDDGSGGVKLDGVLAQWFERARGVPAVEIYSGGSRLTREVWAFTKNVDRDDLLAAATWDFLLGETDRHGENVLLDDSDVPNGGTVKVRLIDNDNALTVDEHTAVSSFLVPGTKWWRILRNVRYGNKRMCCVGSIFDAAAGGDDDARVSDAKEVADPSPERDEADDQADACGWRGDAELLGPEVVFDPRCHVPGRFVGTSLPPGVEPWLRALQKNTTAQIVARYPGLVSPKRAAALKTRAEEYLEGGYEFALLREFSRARMMDCKEEEAARTKFSLAGKGPDGVDGPASGDGSLRADAYASLSPFKWRLNEPCCSLSPSGNCNAVRAKDAPGVAGTDGLGDEAREIFPGNPPGREYRRLYGQPVEVPSPRRRIHPTAEE